MRFRDRVDAAGVLRSGLDLRVRHLAELGAVDYQQGIAAADFLAQAREQLGHAPAHRTADVSHALAVEGDARGHADRGVQHALRRGFERDALGLERGGHEGHLVGVLLVVRLLGCSGTSPGYVAGLTVPGAGGQSLDVSGAGSEQRVGGCRCPGLQFSA